MTRLTAVNGSNRLETRGRLVVLATNYMLGLTFTLNLISTHAVGQRIKLPKIKIRDPVKDVSEALRIPTDSLPTRTHAHPTHKFFVQNRTNHKISVRVNYRALYRNAWTIKSVTVAPNRTEFACETLHRQVNVQANAEGDFGRRAWQTITMRAVPQHFTYIYNRSTVDVRGLFQSQFGSVQIHNDRGQVQATVQHPNGSTTTLTGQRTGNLIYFRYRNGRDRGSGRLTIANSRQLTGYFESFENRQKKAWVLTR